MKMDYSQSLMLRALIRKYEYERDAALANLQVYFEKGVGVGDHPDLVHDMDKLVRKLEHAEGRLKVVISYFANVAPPVPAEETSDDS